jgi:uncharacterized protein (DUF2132 family)
MENNQNNPFHGITLKTILTDLVGFYGWKILRTEVDIRCFWNDPSVNSSLKFLRKTPWARKKVEDLYLRMLKEKVEVQEKKELFFPKKEEK